MAAKKFAWYELLTSDTDAAKRFYADVLGWGTAPFGDGGYQTWMHGEKGFGGLMKQPPAMQGPPAWMGYIGVDDADEAAARVAAAGGSVHVPPADIPGAGRFAVLVDPQGAVFAVHASSGDGEWEPPTGAPGLVSWRELATTDSAAAMEWYGEQFGWTPAGEHDMGGMIYRMFSTGGAAPTGGIYNRMPEMPMSFWCFYVEVADIDATVAKVEAGGGSVLNGPMEVPGGDRVAQVTDPQGATFGLHQPPKR